VSKNSGGRQWTSTVARLPSSVLSIPVCYAYMEPSFLNYELLLEKRTQQEQRKLNKTGTGTKMKYKYTRKDFYTFVLKTEISSKQQSQTKVSMISGFHRDVARSALFGILRRVVVALYRRFGTKHQYHLQGSRSLLGLLRDFLAIKDGTDTLSRNVGIGLPLDSA
jgi:hypothetical protein